MTHSECVRLMTYLVFIWVLFRLQSSVWSGSTSFLSSCPCVLSGNFILWYFLSLGAKWAWLFKQADLLAWCSLVYVPLELITRYLRLRIGKKFISVLRAFGTCKRLCLLAEAFCEQWYNYKTFMLLRNNYQRFFENSIVAEQNIVWWMLSLRGLYNCFRLFGPTTPHVFHTYCSLNESVSSSDIVWLIVWRVNIWRKNSKERSCGCPQQTLLFLCLYLYTNFQALFISCINSVSDVWQL